LTARARGATSQASRTAAERLAETHRARRAGRRVLAPGDASPKGAAGDDVGGYRGLARADELDRLASGVVPLGQRLHPRRARPDQSLRLPFQLLVRHADVIGPTGAGKTTGVIIPWIVSLLQAGIGVVTVDVKGDLTQQVRAEMRRQLGGRPAGLPCYYWNPAGKPTMRWNPLAEITSDSALDAATEAIFGQPSPGDPQPYFYQRDYRWLRELLQLLAATDSAATTSRLLQLATDQPTLQTALARCEPHRTQPLADLANLPPEDHSRATAGLHNALHLLATDRAAAATTISDFTLD
jgi:hypothetical protein